MKAKKEQKKTELKLSHESTVSKRKFTEAAAVAARQSRDEHAKRVKKKAIKLHLSKRHNHPVPKMHEQRRQN